MGRLFGEAKFHEGSLEKILAQGDEYAVILLTKLVGSCFALRGGKTEYENTPNGKLTSQEPPISIDSQHPAEHVHPMQG